MRQLTAVLLALLVLGVWGCGGPAAPPGQAPGGAAPSEVEPAGTEPGGTDSAAQAANEAQAAAVAADEAGAAPSAGAGAVTVYRDGYGVPHIFAESETDAAFAIGYTQAEDRLADLYANVRLAIGRRAETGGPSFVDEDYLVRLLRIEEHARESFEAAPPEIQALLRAYLSGVEAFVAEHPDQLPGNALELQPWHPLAVGQTMIMGWTVGTVFGKLNRRPDEPGFGSNGWVVAPSRTADGRAVLLTDVHQAWEGLALYHEARVEAPDFTMTGYFIVGTPVVGLGHNGHTGWAYTTGGPDTADVYEIKLNPAMPTQYEYDGEWRTAEFGPVSIPVKGQEPVTRMVAYTHHGPLIDEPDLERGVAYAGATPYFGPSRLFEQMYRLVKARNAAEFQDALRLNQLMPQNVLFADRQGNIGYVRTGRAPIRPEGPDWSRPVPGYTSETEWQGIHPLGDLVHIMNPESGYMQNCNISPENMMTNSPLTPDKYLDYLYNVTWDDRNMRGERVVQVLETLNPLTREQAMALAMDVYDLLAEPYQAALRGAVDAVGASYLEDATFAAAVETILEWDGQFAPESAAAAYVRFWRPKVERALDADSIARQEPLSEDAQRRLLELLAETLEELETRHGTATPTYGGLFKVGRGGQYFPVGGANFEGSASARTQTLFNTRFPNQPDDEGRYIADNGSFAMMLMFLGEKGIEAYTCYHWGQSSDPASPHYVDQARDLYSKRQFKPAAPPRGELAGRTASTVVLQVP